MSLPIIKARNILLSEKLESNEQNENIPDLVPLYDAIYNKGDRSYFRGLEDQAERLAQENSCPFVDNELPYGRAEPGHPVIVDYFYHEEVRGSENTGRRNHKK